MLDARYTGTEVDALGADPESDAATAAISAAFKAALMEYMRTNLKIDWTRLYLAPEDDELSAQWRWRTVPDGQYWEPFAVITADDLAVALRRQSFAAGVGGLGLLRPGHPVLRCRIHLESP